MTFSQPSSALVVEGGGMRGIFAAGVLDAFLEVGFAPFDLAIGTSAGACTLASYLSMQHQRNWRIMTGPMRTSRFWSLWRWLRGRHYMDLDWLWSMLDETDRLDVDAATHHPRTKLIVVATHAESGRPVYLVPDAATLNDALKASSALPGAYRGPVVVDGVPLVDGGVSDPIPVEEAIRRGAKDIVVVRTRPADVVKETGLEQRLVSRLLARSPGLSRAMADQAITYQRSVQRLAAPPAGCRITQLAPPRLLRTGRTSRDLAAIEADYALGLEVGRQASSVGLVRAS